MLSVGTRQVGVSRNHETLEVGVSKGQRKTGFLEQAGFLGIADVSTAS